MRLIFGLIGLVLAGAGFGQLSNVRYQAKLVLENGSSLPSSPLIIPPPAGSDLPPCRDVSVFGNGVITYVVPLVLDPGEDQIPRLFDDRCQITISVKGYKKTTVTLHNDAVVVLRQMGDPDMNKKPVNNMMIQIHRIRISFHSSS